MQASGAEGPEPSNTEHVRFQESEEKTQCSSSSCSCNALPFSRADPLRRADVNGRLRSTEILAGSGLVLDEEGSAIQDVLSRIVGHVSAQGIAGEEPELVPLYPWLMNQERSLKNQNSRKETADHSSFANLCLAAAGHQELSHSLLLFRGKASLQEGFHQVLL